jgi:Raf kinase inhibitor-like YbhB/YbcL family protein
MPLFIGDLAISSPDIENLERVPEQFSADGGNETPALQISGAPEGTVEFAVIVHDPDAPIAPGFTHWVVYGIAPDATTIDLEAPGVRVGPNTLGEQSYSGPQPPAGHGQHHYYFWVYALKTKVEGEPARDQFLTTYAEDIIEQARFVATFSRP